MVRPWWDGWRAMKLTASARDFSASIAACAQISLSGMLLYGEVSVLAVTRTSFGDFARIVLEALDELATVDEDGYHDQSIGKDSHQSITSSAPPQSPYWNKISTQVLRFAVGMS